VRQDRYFPEYDENRRQKNRSTGRVCRKPTGNEKVTLRTRHALQLHPRKAGKATHHGDRYPRRPRNRQREAVKCGTCRVGKVGLPTQRRHKGGGICSRGRRFILVSRHQHVLQNASASCQANRKPRQPFRLQLHHPNRFIILHKLLSFNRRRRH